MIMLVAALADIRGSVTKRDAIQFIAGKKWFAIQPEDLTPYPSQTQTREPRWQTLIAWARKDSALRGIVLDHERGYWSLDPKADKTWPKFRARFASGELNVRDGYLWSNEFKRYLCPAFVPCDSDPKRPSGFYDDTPIAYEIVP